MEGGCAVEEGGGDGEAGSYCGGGGWGGGRGGWGGASGGGGSGGCGGCEGEEAVEGCVVALLGGGGVLDAVGAGRDGDGGGGAEEV